MTSMGRFCYLTCSKQRVYIQIGLQVFIWLYLSGCEERDMSIDECFKRKIS